MPTKISPTISVIVPSYNHAQFLPERLMSIKNQTYTNIEIILLDDASKDNSAEILRDFQITEKRVNFLDVNQHNSGSVNQQWLKGLQHARGEFVWIAESDDLASPAFLLELLKQFEQDTEIGLVYCDSNIIDENGIVIGLYDYRYKFYKNLWEQSFVIQGQKLIQDYFIFRNIIPNVSSVLFKKSKLEEALTPNNFKYCGDWLCYINLAFASKIAFYDERLNSFRKHENTTRWHNEESYRAELKEKVTILRLIKSAEQSLINDNFSKALSHLFSNRHKYKRMANLINTLPDKICKNEKVAFYGCNDVCYTLLTELDGKITITTILDKNHAGTYLKNILVVEADKANLSCIEVVVICSLEHKEVMKSELKKANFTGPTFTI
jgi:glycosyltransferase involved in cell wall biosynthesis